MFDSHMYPELVYSIAAERVRTMQQEEAAWQARRARRANLLRGWATLHGRQAPAEGTT